MAKAQTARRRRRANKAKEIDFEKRLTISPVEAAEAAGYGRNQMYAALESGFFPSIRNGRKRLVLTKPFLAILRGEVPPGDQNLGKPTVAKVP
jgi:hypothetical protein